MLKNGATAEDAMDYRAEHGDEDYEDPRELEAWENEQGPPDDLWIARAYENQHPRREDPPVMPHWTNSFDVRYRKGN
jgi:hypothetical protein